MGTLKLRIWYLKKDVNMLKEGEEHLRRAEDIYKETFTLECNRVMFIIKALLRKWTEAEIYGDRLISFLKNDLLIEPAEVFLNI